MLVPTGYDPVTINHWLWFKYQCHECSPGDFQRLFENILKRTRPEFVQIRPYGNIGDRKCDGLFFSEEEFTVFQVYSPDELKQSEIIKKIDEDLDGAVLHWGEALKNWVFVYNARRGLPPDIPGMLQAKQIKYPTVSLSSLSSDALWEMARKLSLQQRSEVLGAPAGYEHLFFSSPLEDSDLKKRLETDSFVLIQDLLSPISLHAVSEAIKPAQSFGAPFFIRPTYGEMPWTDAARQQQIMVHEILSKSRNMVPRFSVFSLSPIPLVIHLGFLLSDRVEVRYFQFDRDNITWNWRQSNEIEIDDNIQISGLPQEQTSEALEVSIAVSLSAKISEIDVQEACPDAKILIDIFVENPDVMWLQSPAQLVRLGSVFRSVLSAVRAKIPRCSTIHLFYAGPTGGGIVLGQQINPRMNPPVQLYQYSQQSLPRYTYALSLTEDLS